MALKRRVDELSDEEVCKDACNVGESRVGADLTTDDWDTFKYSLRAPCPCAGRRQIQDQSCYEVFQKNNTLQEELRRERAHFKSMHKLDQDRLLFDKLRELAYSQGILVRNELGNLAWQGTLKYFFLGQPMCRLGFAHLYGVSWSPRLTTIYNAVMAGAGSAPVDPRYLSREHTSAPTGATYMASEVYSYLVELWHSVAEGLPEGDRRLGKKDHLEWEPPLKKTKHMVVEDDINEHDPYADIEATGDEPIRGPFDDTDDIATSEPRYLPPGSIQDYWKQYCTTRAPGCAYSTFWKVFKGWPFGGKLFFRTYFQHAVCPVCIKHKLLIRMLAHDTAASIKQRQMYSNHLQSQRCDREWYWFLRAQSRMRCTPIITIILDGMDQAKFMWPRSPIFKSHAWDSFSRPKLHIMGVICHGFFCDIYIADADVRKSGSTTCEILGHVLTRLAKLGVDLASAHINLQLDNTARENKNNIVFKTLAIWVCAGLLGMVTVNFLRTGHTHEDIDMIFAALAKYIWRNLHVLETVRDFQAGISNWLRDFKRPYEASRSVFRFFKVRDWKEWGESISKRITGIKGQGASHSFQFIRKKCLPAEQCANLEPYSDGDDVVLRCKQFMCQREHDCTLGYIRVADLQKLPSPWPEREELRNSIPNEYRDMIQRYAERLRRKPYNMVAAADALVAWVTGTQVLGDFLDCSACKLRIVVGKDMMMPPMPSQDGMEAMAFEPELVPIGIAVGPLRLEEKASMQARFIYPLARNLVETYNYKFSHAIVIAEKCYSRLPVQYQADAVAADVHDEAIAVGPADEAPSDEEPPDFSVRI